jgi:hypothetical protein
MKTFSKLILVIISVGMLVTPASAHHGKDFLLVESYELPHSGELYFVPIQAWIRMEGSNTLEAEPSFLLGMFPRLAIELHGHIVKEGGEPWLYEATAPAVHIQFTPHDSSFPLQIGASVEYEFAHHHNEPDRLETRLIIEPAFHGHRLALNLIGEREEEGDATMAYAVGYRREFTEQFSVGMEGNGELKDVGNHEVLATVYTEPIERFTLKLGVGTGLGPDASDISVRTGFVWRF